MDAKDGKSSIDVDDDGTAEDVTVYTGEDGTVFLAWSEEGACYLSWENPADTVWIVVAPCANAEGAYVCNVVGENATCQACNLAGSCSACDMEADDISECKWPASQPGGDNGPVEEETTEEPPVR